MPLTPGLNLPFGIQPVNPVPVDANYGPFASVAAANAAIPIALRYDGLTVQITGSGNYYWTIADLTDTGLIEKVSLVPGIDVYRAAVVLNSARGTSPAPADVSVANWAVGSLIFRATGDGIRQLWIANTTSAAFLDSEEFPDFSQPLGSVPTAAGWAAGELFAAQLSSEPDARLYRWTTIGADLVPVQVPVGSGIITAGGSSSPFSPATGWPGHTGFVADREVDVSTLQDIAAVIKTLIADLKAIGVLAS